MLRSRIKRVIDMTVCPATSIMSVLSVLCKSCPSSWRLVCKVECDRCVARLLWPSGESRPKVAKIGDI